MRIKNIVVDLGHGGIDPNGNYTTAPSKMYTFPDGKVAYEGVLNRQIGEPVEGLLSLYKDLNVVFTVAPADYRDISLGDRVKIANKFDPKETILISIHCNAGKGTGFEIFTSKGHTLADNLAEHIADSVEHVYGKVELKMRYDLSDGDKDKEVDFHVLRESKCPAVLIECGFFDNRKDFDLLSDPFFQTVIAQAITEGVLNYIYE